MRIFVCDLRHECVREIPSLLQLLLATVLKHTLQKYLFTVEQGHTPDFSLNDLLSHAEPLKV